VSSDKLVINVATLRGLLADSGAVVALYDRRGQLIPDSRYPDFARRVPRRVADVIGRSTLIAKEGSEQVWTYVLDLDRRAYLLLNPEHLDERPAMLIVAGAPGRDDQIPDALPIGLLNLDTHFDAKQVNEAAAVCLGIPQEQLLESGWRAHFAKENVDGLIAHFRDPMTAERPYRQPMLLPRPGGAPRSFYVTAVARWPGPRSVGGYGLTLVATDSDRAIPGNAPRTAPGDALSHLMTRSAFLATVDALPEREQRELGFAYLDIDDFRQVNDRLGSRAGDELLRIVALRLRCAVRDTDFIGRVGGDEIAIACRQVRDEAQLSAFGRKLTDLLNDTLSIRGEETALGTSVGLAHGPQALAADRGPGAFSERLLKYADAAMQQAKAEGKGQCRMFSESLNARIAALKAQRWEYQQIVAEDALTCLFQPITGVHGPIALEALTRVTRDLSAHTSIEDLIATAKREGHPWEFLDRLSRLAITTFGRHGRSRPELQGITLNLNIDLVQLLAPDFAGRLQRWCAEAALDPTAVCLEITEAALENEAEALAPLLITLREAGFRLAMDDFGTGFSSIKRLLLYEFDQIKIDRFFIEQALRSVKYRGLLSAVVAMGRSASIQMLVEGIENREEEALCLNAGVEFLQGFHLGPPVSIEEVLRRGGDHAPASAS